MKEDKLDEIMDEWWETEHKEDLRMSGEFCWDEIKEFGEFLIKRFRINLKAL